MAALFDLFFPADIDYPGQLQQQQTDHMDVNFTVSVSWSYGARPSTRPGRK